MEQLVVLGIVVTILTLLVAPSVLAIAAYRRALRLERRLDRLEARGRPAPEASAAREPAVPVRRPAPAAPVETAEPVAPEPVTARPVEVEPELVEPVAEPLAPVPPVAPVTPASAPSPASALVPAPTREDASGERIEWGAPRPSVASKLQGVDWERWVGLRGAAVLGAVFLGIAGILLFQYSIQRGLITPEMRVGLGIGGGVLGLLGSELLRRKGYLMTSNGLAAGSIVVLYASFWAGHYVLALYAMKVAFAAMAAVTALCCVLSLRSRSQLIAVLGLLGGFATPLVLMSALSHPVGLFGYVLLLDLGFVFVGQRRGWSSMGLVGIAGTALIEAVWIGRNLDAEHVTFGLAVLGAFAVLFALAGSGDVRQKRRWLASQASGVLMPFLFAAYFAHRVDMTPYLLPLSGLAALLSGAACWIARRERSPWLPLGAASGSVALLFVWLLSSVPGVPDGLAWAYVACTLGVAAIFHAFVERAGLPAEGEAPGERRARHGLVAAAAFAHGGLLLACLLGGVLATGGALWPWVVGLVAFALLHARLAARGGVPALQLAGALGLALGLSCIQLSRSTHADFPRLEAWHAVLLAGGALFAGLAVLRHGARERRWGWSATSAYALVALAMFLATERVLRFDTMPTEREGLPGTALVLGTSALLGLGAALAAWRARVTPLYCAAVLVTAVVQVLWTGEHHDEIRNADELLVALALSLATFSALVVLPAATRGALSSWAHRVAASSAWVWCLPAYYLYRSHFGTRSDGVIPLLVAVPLGIASLALRPAGAENGAGADVGAGSSATARAWYLGVAASLAALALPLQVDVAVPGVWLALTGLALAALARRLAHAPLFIPSVVATAFGVLLLCSRVLAPRAIDRSDEVVLNLISYAYLLPAAAALGTSLLARAQPGSETERRFANGLRVVRSIAGFGAVALVFAWISLEIFNAWSTGEHVVVSFRRIQTRDLLLSIAWALYALCLLGLGMSRRIGALRWVSLGLLLVTIGKVFLFDLGNLEGLHRVGSMFGLAMSLLLVSFLYQRFVFRAPRTA